MFDYPEGNPSPDVLYVGVGRALSSFEAVEFLLSNLMACALDGDDAVTNAVWQSLKTVNTRFDALRAALNASTAECLNAGNRAAIDDAIKQAIPIMELRNNLAHGVVTETSSGTTKSYLFLPSSAKKGSSPLSPAFCYKASDIADIDKKICEVANNMATTLKPILEARMQQRMPKLSEQDHEQ